MRKLRIPALLLLVVFAIGQAGLAKSTPPVFCVRPCAPKLSGDAKVVVALIDTGINPYNPNFRDNSALAMKPPSTYIPGYPKDCRGGVATATTSCAIPLHITLNAKTYGAATKADAGIWGDPAHDSKIVPGQLYYFPGTKIIGAVTFGAGSTECARAVGPTTVEFPPPAGSNLNKNNKVCPERPIIDDMGHGTMTASRAAGNVTSLAPSARIVEIEGLGAASSLWAANQSWIDVQSNSWGSAVPAPADTADQAAFKEIAKKQLVMVASGNGLGFSGVAPTPTETDSLGAPGVVLVGGHDNGHITAWSGAPAQVVADAYGGITAIHDSFEIKPDPISCCTSTAAPYAAGGAASVVLWARSILGDKGVGNHGGVVARGKKGIVKSGPLADGVFTLAEWRDVLLHTAEARPTQGRHDGLMNFLGGPAAPTNPQFGVGENPFCQFCFTLPVKWSDVPSNVPAYASIGYGAINENSDDVALGVLLGNINKPARADVDDFFAKEGTARGAIFGA